MPLIVPGAGIYQMPLSDYIADPAPKPSLNAGACHSIITQSPLHCWVGHPRLNPAHESEESSRLDFGTVSHNLLLEGNTSILQIINADDWRTKAAKEERDLARAQGKTPILEKDYATVRKMVDVATIYIYDSEIGDDWKKGVSEQTLVWDEKDVWFRSRPDRMSRDAKVLFDFKTCSNAEPNAFIRTILQNGYDLQAGLALRGAYALKGAYDAKFIFVAQEVDPPHAVSFIGLSNAFLALVDKKLDAATKLWSQCLTSNKWPAYTSRVAWVDVPGFTVTQWEEQHGDAGK